MTTATRITKTTKATKTTKTSKTPRKKAVRQNKSIDVTLEERHRMIAEAAYYKAKERNFEMGDQASDWFKAEMEIDAHINNSKLQNDSVSI